MKVVLNVDSLTPPVTGIGTYVRNLIEGLRAHPKVEEVAAFSRAGQTLRMRTHPGGRPAKGLGGETPALASKGYLPESLRSWLREAPLAYGLRDRLAAHRLRRAGCAKEGYLYHEPNLVALPYDGPCVVGVPDLSHLHYPQHHPRARVSWLERNLVRSLQQAHGVICYSAFVRDELVHPFGLAPDRGHVIHLGASDVFRPRKEEELRPVLRRHGLEGLRYLLSVGTLEPRKNLAGLIGAYGSLPPALRREFPLVLASTRGWLT